MFSSPPTEARATPPTARWRSPAGWSLRTRLIATMVALLTVLGLVVGATTEVVLQKSLYQQLDQQVGEIANRAPMILGFKPSGRGPRFGGGPGPDSPRFDPAQSQPEDALVMTLDEPTSGGVKFYDAQGNQVIQAPSGKALAQLAELPADGTFVSADLDGLGGYRLTVRTYGSRTVVIGVPTTPVQTVLVSVAAVVGGVLVLMLVAAATAGAAIIRRTLRPLSRVAATAGRVAELRLDRGEVDLAQRVPDADTDPRTEVGQVGAALNRMLDHVGNALARRHASETQVRQFVADASHELRTPLAAIRGYAELSRRSRSPVPDDVAHILRRVESEARRMTTLVEDLLLLARLDAGRPLAHEPVDLTVLTVDAVSDAHAAGPHHDWRLDLPEEPVVVTGDPARLHQALANLLANARTHTPEGTQVVVRVAADGGQAVLMVTDAGPGIPEALQPHIFERFARGDTSRSRAAGSTGLGLSIVHAVVTAHHGSVAVDSIPGRTAFTVRLPSASGPSRRPDAVVEDLAQVVQ